jgi:hypothetical protein
MNSFLRFIRADASDITAGTTAASAVEPQPHSNQVEETEKRSAASVSGSEPPSLHDMEVARRPKIPFEKRPESWTSVRELVYAVAGERCEKNKRVAMICRFCSRRISGSLATKDYLKRHLHYGSVGEKSAALCSALNKEEIAYFKILISEIFSNDVGRLNIDECSPMSSVTHSPEFGRKRQSFQQKITSWMPCDMKQDEKEAIYVIQTLMFCTSAIPFRFADNKYFRRFCEALRPGFTPLSAKALSTGGLEKVYSDVRLQLRKKISEADNISVLVDGWTDLRFRSIYAFVICFPSTGEEYLYEVKDISHDQHTGIFLETIIEDVVNSIETFNGTRDMKVNAVVSDNAANLKLARELFTEKPENKHIFNVRCFMHAISNVVTKIVQVQFAKRLVSKAQEIVTYVKNSHIAAAHIRDKLFLYSKTSDNNRGLATSNQTRLTSVQLCIESVLNNLPVLREAVAAIGALFTNSSVRNSIMDIGYEYHLRELNCLILPFCKCIMAVQRTLSRLSDVGRYWIYLTNSLEAFLERSISIEGIEEFKVEVAEIFNKATYSMTINATSVSLLLDPRYRATVRREPTVLDSWKMVLLRTARDRLFSAEEIKEIANQTNSYISNEPPFSSFSFGGTEFDPLAWWLNKCETHGVAELARVAVLFFSVPASSAAPERLFSLLDWFQAKRRNGIRLKTMEMMATVKQFHGQEAQGSRSKKKRKRDSGDETVGDDIDLSGDVLHTEHYEEEHSDEESEI